MTTTTHGDPRFRQLSLETLETRQVLAGDIATSSMRDVPEPADESNGAITSSSVAGSDAFSETSSDGAFNDESGPTLDQRLQEARERNAAQSSNTSADAAINDAAIADTGGAFNDESGPTLDQRLQEARERNAAQSSNTSADAASNDAATADTGGGAFNDESGPTLDQRLQEARERNAAQSRGEASDVDVVFARDNAEWIALPLPNSTPPGNSA